MRAGLIDAVQVIYNIFDQNPEDELFPACREKDVAVIARVPFDEGSLTGTLTLDSTWPKGDWRNTYFVAENLKTSVAHADALKPLLKDGMTMPEMALRFILNNKDVSTIIPGMRKIRNVESNIAASAKGPLPASLHAELRHHRWDPHPDPMEPMMPRDASQAVISSGAARRFFFPLHSREMVELRREKSLLFFSKRMTIGGKFRPTIENLLYAVCLKARSTSVRQRSACSRINSSRSPRSFCVLWSSSAIASAARTATFCVSTVAPSRRNRVHFFVDVLRQLVDVRFVQFAANRVRLAEYFDFYRTAHVSGL